MLHFKEAQVRTLEEMEEKHQAMTEEAQQEKEEEKKLLVTVGAHAYDELNKKNDIYPSSINFTLNIDNGKKDAYD